MEVEFTPVDQHRKPLGCNCRMFRDLCEHPWIEGEEPVIDFRVLRALRGQ